MWLKPGPRPPASTGLAARTLAEQKGGACPPLSCASTTQAASIHLNSHELGWNSAAANGRDDELLAAGTISHDGSVCGAG